MQSLNGGREGGAAIGLPRQGTRPLAIPDPAVIEAHHGNRTVIAGRYGTVFRNAFTVVCPVAPERIRSVRSPPERFAVPQAEFSLSDMIRR
ncbi:hypothetical protein [Methylobacterium sp. Leaf102]|uniref:hypothetical protein n=1 Tax=Methylobacterium sp. Leaf102 TaxID=1736253 RepID=UPI0012E794AA|nr:hypothetical protein [Methylobacterium sp. Leaf102]